MSDPLRIDFVWNYLAVFVAGVSGILLFLLVGALYGPDALGVFNKVFAVYIVLSQVAAFGVHLSILKHLAEATPDARTSVLRGGLCALIPSALGVPLLLCFAAAPVGMLLRSAETGYGLFFAAAGLVFFFPEQDPAGGAKRLVPLSRLRRGQLSALRFHAGRASGPSAAGP